MTNQDFVSWLTGYLEGWVYSNILEIDHQHMIERIQEEMKKINNSGVAYLSTPNNIYFPGQVSGHSQ